MTRVARPLELLRTVEWSKGEDGDQCPMCGAPASEGHWPSCEMPALLAEYERELALENGEVIL